MCIKFCLKLGRTATKIYQILKIILRKWTVSRIHTFDWPSKGRNEGTSFNDAEHSKHSSPRKMYENVSRIKELVHENRHVSAQFGVSMAFVMIIAISMDVMLYWAVISCVWGELPASIFRVVRKDYPEDEGNICSKTMVTNYHVPDDLNLHILLSSTSILPPFSPLLLLPSLPPAAAASITETKFKLFWIMKYLINYFDYGIIEETWLH
jgi:hypothetical protein